LLKRKALSEAHSDEFKTINPVDLGPKYEATLYLAIVLWFAKNIGVLRIKKIPGVAWVAMVLLYVVPRFFLDFLLIRSETR
jgi:hypothetical protein